MKSDLSRDTAFEILFKDFFRPLVYFALRLIDDKAVAEDIVQDLFVVIFEKKESLNIKSSDTNYLYTAVRNRCIDFLRKKKVQEAHGENLKETYTPNQVDPSEQLEIIEFESKYVQALESLSPKCREVFKLSRMEGKKNSEIAAALNLSKRTVEKHISLALKIIRKKLKHYLLD